MDELYTLEWSKPVFDNFENSDISQNTSVFWRTGLWYQLLVGETTGGGFETLRGDKTQSFISRTKAYSSKNKHKKLNTRPVSFFLVFLSNLSTQNNIHLATYLYTNSKQDISTFKCEGGWRLAAGRLQVVAGRWQLVAASGGCLPWPSRWIEFNTTSSAVYDLTEVIG